MHTLPTLTYSYDALEPHIDAQTIEIHHRKHHQSYVDKLNAALQQHPQLLNESAVNLISDLDAAPDDARTAIRHHGGGHANHSLFFTSIAPGGAEPIYYRWRQKFRGMAPFPSKQLRALEKENSRRKKLATKQAWR